MGICATLGAVGVKGLWGVVALGALGACPNEPGAFECDAHHECGDLGAICQPTGSCSFVDSSCVGSGQRYGVYAREDLADTCVQADIAHEGETGGDGGSDAAGELGGVVEDSGDSVGPGSATDGPSNVTAGTCGDHAQDSGEACDGDDLAGESCASLGFAGGTLACSETCTFDTSNCDDDSRFQCGDNTADPGEVCDGTDLAGTTCASAGFTAGTLSCATDCQLDTSMCTRCGNGVREGTEACDDGNSVNGDGCSNVCQLDGGAHWIRAQGSDAPGGVMRLTCAATGATCTSTGNWVQMLTTGCSLDCPLGSTVTASCEETSNPSLEVESVWRTNGTIEYCYADTCSADFSVVDASNTYYCRFGPS